MRTGRPTVAPAAVHVVIPAHNEAETIGACLDSVLAATSRAFRDQTGVPARA